MHRCESRREETDDDSDFVPATVREKRPRHRPPEHTITVIGRIYRRVHRSSWLVRYVVYTTPLGLLILIPLLLGNFIFRTATVGGVYLLWFCVWLEMVWLTLWASRILAKCLPWPIGQVAKLFVNNNKKWRDMGKQLEVPMTLFFWALALQISFLPTMTNHHLGGSKTVKYWESVMDKVITSILVALVLNLVEKIVMQLIAMSFHVRTYGDRIAENKKQIRALVRLYTYSREHWDVDDQEFADKPGRASGARTPKQLAKDMRKSAVNAINKVGDVAGKIAADFTGRKVPASAQYRQLVLNHLSSHAGSRLLARRLYRTFCGEGVEMLYSEDLTPAFPSEEEAQDAFTAFDKDMNGDISISDLEAMCFSIGFDRKSITASLKDLDLVVGKLDNLFLFIVIIISVLVFFAMTSASAVNVLASAGSAVLALSWLFSATAQELLQSLIFIFVKHPFDVGDRVSIYGNTGSTLKGDDYFVKEIALLYTEFRKMEGHIVQAPNSYLNTLFILNQRRSGPIAEAVPVTVKFGTTLAQIQGLRNSLLEFVSIKKREYGPVILTELRDVTEAHSVTLNVIFFYKSNWQNEMVRLVRRNEFICALMVSMQELGIEGPRMRYPGQKESFPMYLQQIPHVPASDVGQGNYPDGPGGSQDEPLDTPFVRSPMEHDGRSPLGRMPSVRHAGGRQRSESLAQMDRRVDFSLGTRDEVASDITGDVHMDRQRARMPPAASSSSRSRERSGDRGRGSSELTRRSTSTSGQSKLTRIGTDSSMARERSNRRNLFFSRSRAVDAEDAMESGMSDIPEGSENLRSDPRSGLVSPAEWRTD